jgi:hypothetical protein
LDERKWAAAFKAESKITRLLLPDMMMILLLLLLLLLLEMMAM